MDGNAPVYYVRLMKPTDEESNEEYFQKLKIEENEFFPKQRGKDAKAPKILDPLDLRVGDTLRIIEISPMQEWCKAQLLTKASVSEKRKVYGLSTFGRVADRVKVHLAQQEPQQQLQELHVEPQQEEQQAPDPQQQEQQAQPDSQQEEKQDQQEIIPQVQGFSPIAISVSSLSGEEIEQNHDNQDSTGRQQWKSYHSSASSTSPRPDLRVNLLRNNKEPNFDVRIHFRDGSSRSLDITEGACSGDVCSIICRRVPSLAQHCIITQTGANERILLCEEYPVAFMRQWKDRDSNRFLFSLKDSVSTQLVAQFNEWLRTKGASKPANLLISQVDMDILLVSVDKFVKVKHGDSVSEQELEFLLCDLVQRRIATGSFVL